MRFGWGMALCIALAAAATADVLELRDGRRFEGRLRAASETTLHFETAQGVQQIPLDAVAGLRFEPAAAAEGRSAAPTTTRPRHAASPRRVQVPAGTRLRVRIADSIDPRQSAEGDRFSGLLETAISVGERIVVPARSPVYGVVTAASKSGPVTNQLQLELSDLQIRGARVEVVTGTHERVVLPSEDAPPANAGAPESARIVGGSLLEFRLLQAFELDVR